MRRAVEAWEIRPIVRTGPITAMRLTARQPSSLMDSRPIGRGAPLVRLRAAIRPNPAAENPASLCEPEGTAPKPPPTRTHQGFTSGALLPPGRRARRTSLRRAHEGCSRLDVMRYAGRPRPVNGYGRRWDYSGQTTYGPKHSWGIFRTRMFSCVRRGRSWDVMAAGAVCCARESGWLGSSRRRFAGGDRRG
jgi:hypothetical protein